ncbi:MAG: hypothetical protein RLZZ165_2069 [Bacteroidota bacterium]|jgi:hypothetical protein
MAQYPITDYTLHFSEDYTQLLVRKNRTGGPGRGAQYDLRRITPPIGIQVVDGNYVIQRGLCKKGTVAFEIDVEVKRGSVNFSGDRLGGLNIIDLRDTGRVRESMLISLSCGPLGLIRTTGPYALKVLVNNPKCILSPVP